jgi:hypothetical protein
MFSARLDMAGTIAGAAAAEHDASVKRYKKGIALWNNEKNSSNAVIADRDLISKKTRNRMRKNAPSITRRVNSVRLRCWRVSAPFVW